MADQIPPTNPWLYQAWAARQPGNTANQWEGIATFGQNPSQDADLAATYRMALEGSPFWDSIGSKAVFQDNPSDASTNPSRTNTGAGLDYSGLKGYTLSQAGGNDNNRLYGLFDPQGNLISGSIEGLTNDSLHHEDLSLIHI